VNRLPFEVSAESTLATSDADEPETSQPIDKGVEEQFKPLTVYISFSLVTFNDNICE